MEVVRIQVNSKLAWRASQSEGVWTAVCDPMGLTVVGDTWSELLSTTVEVVDSLLRDLWQSSELEQFLRDRGWTCTGMIPPPEQGEAPRFDLPVPVLQA